MHNEESLAVPVPPEMNMTTAALPTETLISRLTVGGVQAKANLDEFVAQIELLPYLEAEPSKLVTWPGHPTTICKIQAGIWQTDPLVESKNGKLVFPDPARHYDVHFELQVLQWRARMALYLHYETNPYFSEVKLRSRAEHASVEQYYQRRNEFIHELTKRVEVPGFKISPGTVQVGKAEYDFAGKTVGEVSAWLQPVIDEVACSVNGALFKVDLRRRIANALGPVDSNSAAPGSGGVGPTTTASVLSGTSQV